jgi:hypothetical protein
MADEKKKPHRYDAAFLAAFCEENKITLNQTCDNVNRETRLVGNCLTDDCDGKFDRGFRGVVNGAGAYCNKCTTMNRIQKLKKTYLKLTGFDHPSQNPKIKEAKVQTNLLRRGVRCSLQDQTTKEKIKQSCIKIYGSENPSKTLFVKEKAIQTNLKRRGVKYSLQDPYVRNKGKQTNIKRYGSENPFQSKICMDKSKQTCIKRYGYEHATQNPEIAEKASKNSYRTKDYVLPSGAVKYVQGYEPFALDELLLTFDEDEILTGATNVPKIDYTGADGKAHTHMPDIYIPFINTLIEVKSTWTAKKKDDSIFLKQAAAKSHGYNYEIWVYNAKGQKVETHS